MHREAKISNYFLAVFSAISLILLALPLSTPVRVAKTCLIYVISPTIFYGEKAEERLAGLPARVQDLITADIENRALRDRSRDQAWTQARLQELESENERLRQTLKLKAPTLRSPLWAHVMERDPIRWYHSFIVDAGAEQGVVLNSAVLGPSQGDLVAIGRVAEVRSQSSMVLLLTDELSSVAAYLSSSTVEGLIQGQGDSRLLMNYLPADGKMEPGELAYTSPTSATFPADILVGTVIKVYPRDQFLAFQSVEVKPAVEASVLKEVMILLPPENARAVTP